MLRRSILQQRSAQFAQLALRKQSTTVMISFQRQAKMAAGIEAAGTTANKTEYFDVTQRTDAMCFDVRTEEHPPSLYAAVPSPEAYNRLADLLLGLSGCQL